VTKLSIYKNIYVRQRLEIFNMLLQQLKIVVLE